MYWGRLSLCIVMVILFCTIAEAQTISSGCDRQLRQAHVQIELMQTTREQLELSVAQAVAALRMQVEMLQTENVKLRQENKTLVEDKEKK